MFMDTFNHMGLVSLWWVLLAAGVLALAWLGIQATGSSRRDHESAEETIRKRYARGEIDQQTYDDMLRALRR